MGDQQSVERISCEAADWVARLQSPDVTKGEVTLFEEWRDRDERHVQAFGRLLLISYLASKVPSILPSDEPRLVKEPVSSAVGRLRNLYRHRRPFAIAASLAFATSLLGLLFVASVSNAPFAFLEQGAVEEVFTTAIGENRTIDLADGSHVTLGGQTRLDVALTKRSRTVTLSHGEAYFEVAKDAHRDFMVRAGGVSITAVGTAFNVNRYSDGAVVTVTEGRVLVQPQADILANLLRQGVPLDSGEQSIADNSGIGDATEVTDLASILSWRSGRLSFRERPLRESIRDVNRYTPKPLVLADPSIGDITVTGTVSPGNIRGWIRSLERAFALKAIEGPDRITLQSAAVEQVGQ